ncbi:MAG: hypothetical protein CFE37_08385 [Alphaproteobacteria bacterium PA4]|nr:MAG: hypothetical protein CFE37_08385 [Alphaproteobacteria bacterium PA4]
MISRIAIGLAVALAAPTPALAGQYGVFRNPSGSVHVRLADCGKQLCGTIVKADAKARADAARAGQTKLIGLQLFRNLLPVATEKGAPRRWEGQVYIPDKDRTVSGSAELNGRTLTVKGCLLGDALCKAQDWVRVG